MIVDSGFWADKRVLVTGHTGFKGGWLSLWLEAMGAETHGFSLAPPTRPNLYEEASVAKGLATTNLGDIRDREGLEAVFRRVRPEIVFHLAAQSLVREAYRNPAETYDVNVLGLVSLLEAVRSCDSVRAVVNVTSDKCYDSAEPSRRYREEDRVGGSDPYSSSKGCAELVTAAYRKSFLAEAGVAISTARAGNVIGGGDWAPDRLVPDAFRALHAGTRLLVRYPGAVRPWQHVLEPVSGYLLLAQRLYEGADGFAEAWNFGPAGGEEWTVQCVVERLARNHPELQWQRDTAKQVHEAPRLTLDSSKARARLGWEPRWDVSTALDRTSEWYAAWKARADMRACTVGQIREYARR